MCQCLTLYTFQSFFLRTNTSHLCPGTRIFCLYHKKSSLIKNHSHLYFFFFFLKNPPPPKISPFPLHDPLPIPEGKWSPAQLAGAESGGAGEVRLGRLSKSTRFIATVEPMHGTNLVLYTEPPHLDGSGDEAGDRKSTRLNSSHSQNSYAVFCLKK